MIFFIGRISFIVLIVFLVALVLQLVYIWVVFGKTAFYKKKKQPDGKREPVSVIVCSRDSLHYLTEHIHALINQDYPDFEIVIVNNCSTDETQMFLDDLERIEPRVKVVQLRQQLNFFHGKKFPLSMGIKSAQNDLLVFTDPECNPDGSGWLSSVVDSYEKNTEISIGYCYRKPKNGLADKVMRFIELIDGLNYMSFALMGRPYTADGKCLSYRKALFYKVKGFTSHYTVSAGDDSLFVNDNAKKGTTAVLIDPDNAIAAEPINFRTWFLQKSFKCSAIPHYGFLTKLLLSVYPFTQVLFYASFIALGCLEPSFETGSLPVLYIPILVLLFLLRFVSQTIVLQKASRQLKVQGLMPWFFLGDIAYLLLNPLMVFLGAVDKGSEWGD